MEASAQRPESRAQHPLPGTPSSAPAKHKKAQISAPLHKCKGTRPCSTAQHPTPAWGRTALLSREPLCRTSGLVTDGAPQRGPPPPLGCGGRTHPRDARGSSESQGMLPKPWDTLGLGPRVTSRSGKEDLFPGQPPKLGKINQTLQSHQERTEEGTETRDCTRGYVQYHKSLLSFLNSTLIIIKKWS